MGVFDTVLIPCPHCGREYEEQTKMADNPSLRTYHLEDAETPPEVIVGVLGIYTCASCNKEFKVSAHVIPCITRKLLIQEWEGD